MKIYCAFLIFWGGLVLQQQAQDTGFEAFQSQYASVLAESYQYQPADWELQGAVASFVRREYEANGQIIPYNTMSYHFDSLGNLVFWMQGDTADKKHIHQYKIFTFGKAGKLQKITHREHSQQSRLISYFFSPAGYMSQCSLQSTKDSSLNFTAHYQYSRQFQALKIDYHYPVRNAIWERKTVERYDYTFDEAGRLSKERLQSKYASTLSLRYDSLSGCLIGLHRLADCFPSNSCVNLRISFAYDSLGNLVEEHSFDATVRNSLWTLGENYEARYNAQNLLIEKRILASQGPFLPLPSASNSNKDAGDSIFRYEYRFDERGNWVERIEYRNASLVRRIEREIRYF